MKRTSCLMELFVPLKSTPEYFFSVRFSVSYHVIPLKFKRLNRIPHAALMVDENRQNFTNRILI